MKKIWPWIIAILVMFAPIWLAIIDKLREL